MSDEQLDGLRQMLKCHAYALRRGTLEWAIGEIERLRERIRLATALTDTGSPEFKKEWCDYFNPDHVPGWPVVERIREVLQ